MLDSDPEVLRSLYPRARTSQEVEDAHQRRIAEYAITRDEWRQ